MSISYIEDPDNIIRQAGLSTKNTSAVFDKKLYKFAEGNVEDILRPYVIAATDSDRAFVHFLQLSRYGVTQDSTRKTVVLLQFRGEWKDASALPKQTEDSVCVIGFQYMFSLYALQARFGYTLKTPKPTVWTKACNQNDVYDIQAGKPSPLFNRFEVQCNGIEIALDPTEMVEAENAAANLRDLGEFLSKIAPTKQSKNLTLLLSDLAEKNDNDILGFGLRNLPYGADSGIFHPFFQPFYRGTVAGSTTTLTHVKPYEKLTGAEKDDINLARVMLKSSMEVVIPNLEKARLTASSKPAAPPATTITPSKPPSSVLTTDTRAKRLEELRPHMEKLIAAYRDSSVIQTDFDASLEDTRYRNAFTAIEKLGLDVSAYAPSGKIAYGVYTPGKVYGMTINPAAVKYAAYGLLLLAVRAIYTDAPNDNPVSVDTSTLKTVFNDYTKKVTPKPATIDKMDANVNIIENLLTAPIGDAAVRKAIAEFDNGLKILNNRTTVFDVESNEEAAKKRQLAVTAAYNTLDDATKTGVKSEVERVEKTDINAAAYTRLVTLLDEAIEAATITYTQVISAPDLVSAAKNKTTADNQYITAKGFATAAGNHATDKSAITAKMAPLEKTKGEAEARITTLETENDAGKAKREQEEKVRTEKARDAYVAALAEIDKADDVAAVKAAVTRAEDARKALFPLEDSDRIISHAINSLKVLLERAAKASAAEYEKVVSALGIDASKAAYAVARATDKDVEEITTEITRIDPGVRKEVDTILASLEAAKEAARANLKESPEVALLKEIEDAKTSNSAWASRLETKVVPTDPIRQDHLREALQLIKAANTSALTQHEIRKHLLLVRLGKVL